MYSMMLFGLFFGGFVKEVVPALFFGQHIAFVIKAVGAPYFALMVGDEVTAVQGFVQHIHDHGARLGA